MKSVYKTTVACLIVVALLLSILALLGVISRLQEDVDAESRNPVTEFKAPGVRCFSWRGQFACIAQDADASDDRARHSLDDSQQSSGSAV
ncbi:hypothetical protein [Burkholderia gladioli]|uniref:hypothetical protein n=1 Tax=Burkholderia gladioli TaxID=28095 RepID=UPI00163EA8A9|nr:hypothetical protein [Burkholderia gladioli]